MFLCQISFQLGFDHSHLRSVNNLDSLPFYDHAYRAGRLQQLFINQRRVCDRAAESCRAAVHGSDIVSSSHTHCNGCTPAVFTVFCLTAAFSLFRFSPAGIHISLRVELRLLVIILTSRCFQIKFFNQKTEQNVIQKEIHNSCRNDAKPAGFRIALQHTENHQIQKTTGTTITITEVDNKGIVDIFGQDKTALDGALNRIKAIVAIPEIGETYHGKIRSIVAFGAFVEIMPGKDALLHISEIDYKRFETMEETGLKEGDEIDVKLIGVDPKTNKLKLSRKALLPKPEGYVERERRPRPERGERGERRDRGERRERHEHKED